MLLRPNKDSRAVFFRPIQHNAKKRRTNECLASGCNGHWTGDLKSGLSGQNPDVWPPYVQPLLSLFHDGVNVSVPIQILRDGGSLNDSTAATVLFMIVSGWRAVFFLLKSTFISTVLSMFISRLL